MTCVGTYSKLESVSSQPFSDRFNAALQSSGLNKYRLWKLSGVGQPTLSKISRGVGVPDDDTILLIAPHIGVPVEELVDLARAERAARVRRRLDIGGPDFDAVIAAGAAGQYPITQDERESIDECAALGVWTSEIEGSDLWAIPPDDERRRSVFAYLAELAELARNHARRAL